MRQMYSASIAIVNLVSLSTDQAVYSTTDNSIHQKLSRLISACMALVVMVFLTANFASNALSQNPATSATQGASSQAASEPTKPTTPTTQFEWVDISPKLLANVPRGYGGRAAIMVDLAIFNALNTITPRFKPYGSAASTTLAASPDASAEAAISAAAMTIFANTPGIDGVLLEKTYQEQLKKVTDGTAKTAGIALGKRAALAIIAMRLDDDFGRIEPSTRELAAGVYEFPPDRKTKPNIAMSKIRPYGIARLDAYDPGAPLPPESAAAKRDLAETKARGGRMSSSRSSDETAAAIFWNSGEDNDMVALIRAIAEKKQMSALAVARMLALLDIADYDGRIVTTAFKDKYHYWRPYNAIRGKFADPTLRDDKWEPLLDTPLDPDYPSGSGMAGGTFARYFEYFNADNAVPLSWKNSTIRHTRSWPNGETLGREFGYSRIWAGVHSRYSVEAGHRLGRKIMDEIVATQLTPLSP